MEFVPGSSQVQREDMLVRDRSHRDLQPNAPPQYNTQQYFGQGLHAAEGVQQMTNKMRTNPGAYASSNERQDFLDRSANARPGGHDRPGTGTVTGTNQVFNPFQTDKMQETINYS